MLLIVPGFTLYVCNMQELVCHQWYLSTNYIFVIVQSYVQYEYNHMFLLYITLNNNTFV